MSGEREWPVCPKGHGRLLLVETGPGSADRKRFKCRRCAIHATVYAGTRIRDFARIASDQRRQGRQAQPPRPGSVKEQLGR